MIDEIGHNPKNVRQLPPDAVVITPLSADECRVAASNAIRELGVTPVWKREFADVAAFSATNLSLISLWPAKAETGGCPPVTNRAQMLRPKDFAEGAQEHRYPAKLAVGVPPQWASCDAEGWIRRVLHPAFIPNDLANRMILVQRDPATASAIYCRYEIDGCAIQIGQLQSAMWVMIRPGADRKIELSDTNAIAMIFRDVFTKGNRMADFMGDQDSRLGKVYSRDHLTVHPGTNDDGFWYEWFLWYSDANAVGVLLRKCSDDIAHVPNLKEPWF